MNALANKNIILAVCGSIAAYKIAFLTRLLVKKKANVKILMTPAATQFISPLTLATLSNNSVTTDVMSENQWNNHVEYGLWGDIFLVAPLTANTLAKMANGNCDNMVLATWLSAKCPTVVAPAMDLDMWTHPATQRNIDLLKNYGTQIIPVGHGELASGLVGNGRLAEPEDIVSYLETFFSKSNILSTKKILITAGPTHETIDPVRFIGNHSSGKMGIHIANTCARLGAEVTLILGPSSVKVDGNLNINVIHVTTGQEMFEASNAIANEVDAFIFAAAVADYRPKNVSDQKVKKKQDTWNLEMEKTIDIASTIGQNKLSHQVSIGFALETENEKENALKKLNKKNFDFIVLNSLNDKGAGFKYDTNKIRIFKSIDNQQSFPLEHKSKVAVRIVDELILTMKHKGLL